VKFFTINKIIRTALALVLLSTTAAVSAQTNIILVNNDGANEGFNDNSAPFPNQTGNNGSTLGQQRLNVFQAAADFWEAQIDSSVTIRVAINFDPLACSANQGILGSAGPNSVFQNPNGAPLPLADTWYVEAVANSLFGFDQDTSSDDISARFNSDIDNNNSCLDGTNWWLGINSPVAPGTISLFDTVLHEIGHGLGVLSLVSLQTGQQFQNTNDAYSNHLFDEQTQEFWRDMTNAERFASSTNTGNLTWRGPNADNNSSHLNAISRTNGNIRMFAPNPVQPGSSVSHWDTILSPDELMEPSATLTSDARSTIQLLADVGWDLITGPGEIGFNSAQTSVSETSGLARIPITRTGGSDGAASVTINSSNVTALGGVDYEIVDNQVVSWADGEMGTRILEVEIFEDDIIEEDGETALLTISGSTGDATLGRETTTLRILDPDDGDDFLLMVVPAIAAAANPRAPAAPNNPLWSVANDVCCPTSSAVFSVTQGSASRSSTAPSCTVPARQSSEVESTAGAKSFNFLLNSSGCGPVSGTFGFTLENNTRYLLVSNLNGNPIGIDVFSGPLNQVSNARNAGSSPTDGLIFERTIEMKPSFSEIGNNEYQSVRSN